MSVIQKRKPMNSSSLGHLVGVFDFHRGRKFQAVEEVKDSFQAKDYNLPKTPFKPKKNCQDAETAIKKKYKEIWRDQTFEKGKQWFGR